MGKQLTNQEIIERIIDVHGDKYDCSKVDYINSRTSIILICKKHGEFKYYIKHLKEGRGCPMCSKNKTIIDFIEKARDVHGSKYDYSKSNYTGRHNKLIITCPIHGEFEQEAGAHLSGCGCPKCANEHRNDYKKLSTEDFIKRAKEVHGNKYDYSKVNYKSLESKVTIICPIHGEFEQRADSHLFQKSGCPKCNQSKGEIDVENYLIKNNIKYKSQYSIQIDQLINSSGYAYIDFYLPDYNLFIEYNGKQHYTPVQCFGGQLTFEHQQKRDQYVIEYCNKNNINLLIIKYLDNVEEMLNQYFVGHNYNPLQTSC